MLERHLRHDDDICRVHLRLQNEHLVGAIQHVQRDVRERPEAAPLHEHRFSVQELSGLHDLAVRSEHRRVGQPSLDELKRHQPVVHAWERGAGELGEVDLDSLAGDVVDQ